MADIFKWVKSFNASALRLLGSILLCVLNIEILTWWFDAINVKFISLFSLLLWDTSNQHLSQTNRRLKPSKNFIRGCWGCQSCWFTVFLLSSLTSQRPKHSVGYKQKEFLRAAKVVIRWLLYYSGIRSDERKRKGRPETPSHKPFQGWYPTSRQLNIKTWWVWVRLQHWASVSGQLWFYP